MLHMLSAGKLEWLEVLKRPHSQGQQVGAGAPAGYCLGSITFCVLSTSHTLFLLIFTTPYEVSTIIILILQM